MGSTKLRNSMSFPNVLLSFLNFIIFILSSASILPIILLKNPPTTLGYALLTVSAISIISSFTGFYSHLTPFCFTSHIALLLSSTLGQILSALALFTREKQSLLMLRSPRDPREAKFLVRVECGAMMSIIVLQVLVLAVNCLVQICWVRDFGDLEAERAVWDQKRSLRVAKVQEESMANAIKTAEIKNKEFDEKMKVKYGDQWVKTDYN